MAVESTARRESIALRGARAALLRSCATMRNRLPVALFALLLASAAFANHLQVPKGETLVHVERSAWQTIVVTDSATRRCLRFGAATDAFNQSCQLLGKPTHLALDYTRAMAALLLLWQPAPKRVLLIGVGGGSLPKALAVVRPELEIDAVDIDEAVLRIAERFFGLAAGPRLRLHAADGRAFVAEARARGERFDAVLLDAFDADGIAPALFSEEFLRDVRGLLAPGGVFLANTFTAPAAYTRESAAAEAVFGRFLNVRLADRGGNRMLVAAADQAALPGRAELLSTLPAQRAALARIGIDDPWLRRLRFIGRDWQ